MNITMIKLDVSLGIVGLVIGLYSISIYGSRPIFNYSMYPHMI